MSELSTETKHPGECINQNTLPPSGLAADILKKDEPSLPPDVQTNEISKGPDQIYTFADDLRKNHAEDDLKKLEKQLEIWVTFTLGSETYALPVSHVQEILRVSAITNVPHAPQSVRGVANIRGRVLPVVDLKVRLGMKKVEISNASRILVAESRGRLIGLLVDSVHSVIRLLKNSIEPLSPDIMTSQSDYITGVYHQQESIIILLNVDRLLTIKDSLQTDDEFVR